MELLENEIFKDIIGYEDNYSISNIGRVYGKQRKKIKTNQISKKGYFVIMLYKKQKPKLKKIHRLIAEHFISNPHNSIYINHIDGNKLNYKIDNLEWCTHKQNMQHAFRTGLVNNSGEKNGMSKRIESKILEIKKLLCNTDLIDREIAVLTGVSRRYVCSIKNKKLWKHIKYNNETVQVLKFVGGLE